MIFVFRFDFSFKENKIIGVGWVSLRTVSFILPVQEKDKCNSVEQTNNKANSGISVADECDEHCILGIFSI